MLESFIDERVGRGLALKVERRTLPLSASWIDFGVAYAERRVYQSVFTTSECAICESMVTKVSL